MRKRQIKIGFPRMRHEPGEKRDFLPAFIETLSRRGAGIVLEEGYGSGIGLNRQAYLEAAPSLEFVSHEEAFRQSHVLVLRCPHDDELRMMRAGSCLISMLHYPTRPQRVEFLRSLGLEALSLDSIKDDTGRRLIENLKAVAWNGMEMAVQALRKNYPAFADPKRPPLQFTLIGAGAVGAHVVQAAVRYGSETLRREMINAGVAGVQVTVVDYDVTSRPETMESILRRTDILIDATQRPDATRPVIPNSWVGMLPGHSVILDLSVDPNDCTTEPPQVKGVEGIPQGNLDHYVFAPDDPAFDALPHCIRSEHRRTVVSCYSWPGIYPKDCMQIYGQQLQPILRTILEKGGVGKINPNGKFFERAVSRGLLSHFVSL